MKITVEIPDEIVPSLEKFIERYHSERRFDELTGQPKQVPLYTAQQFVLGQIALLLDRVDDEFPPASTEEQRAQIAALQQQIKSQIRPKEVEEE